MEIICELSVLNVLEGGIQLWFEVAVMVFAEDDLVGGVADAFPDFAADLRLEGGGIDVVAFRHVAVAERAAVVEVDAGGGLQRLSRMMPASSLRGVSTMARK